VSLAIVLNLAHSLLLLPSPHPDNKNTFKKQLTRVTGNSHQASSILHHAGAEAGSGAKHSAGNTITHQM
jgi:hypothetical protein